MTGKQLVQRLAEVARIGALFVEGEDCLEALHPEARAWTNADDVNFDPRVAVPLKKTLLRIEMIESFPYYAILWRRRPDNPGRVEVVLAGRMNSPFDLGKGKFPDMFPALRQVFARGKPASVVLTKAGFERTAGFRYGHAAVARNDSLLRAGKRVVSYFHPIRDSRDEVVAALELACVGSDN